MIRFLLAALFAIGYYALTSVVPWYVAWTFHFFVAIALVRAAYWYVRLKTSRKN